MGRSIFLELVVAMDQNFLTVARGQVCGGYDFFSPNFMKLRIWGVFQGAEFDGNIHFCQKKLKSSFSGIFVDSISHNSG